MQKRKCVEHESEDVALTCSGLSKHNMAEVDPELLLEWLNKGQGDERDTQLIALEQLCMLLLMSDNVDRCFE
ncbi:E3 ubiquitin-protein ligase Ufd4, partial [Frankliniella fusca]